MIETIFYTIFEYTTQRRHVSLQEETLTAPIWKVDGRLVSQSYFLRRRAAALFDEQIASEQPDNVDLVMYLLLQRWQEADEERLNYRVSCTQHQVCRGPEHEADESNDMEASKG
jgi:hypothetical protein